MCDLTICFWLIVSMQLTMNQFLFFRLKPVEIQASFSKRTLTWTKNYFPTKIFLVWKTQIGLFPLVRLVMRQALVFWSGECKVQMSRLCHWPVSSNLTLVVMLYIFVVCYYSSSHHMCSKLLALCFWKWYVCQHRIWSFIDVWSAKCCGLSTSSSS